MEKKTLEMPVHGGGTKEIEVDYKFVSLDEGQTYIGIAEYLQRMF